jgi:hypothetical protein
MRPGRAANAGRGSGEHGKNWATPQRTSKSSADRRGDERAGGGAAIANLGGASPCTAAIATACLIDNNLASATTAATAKSGYIFAATVGASPNQYEAAGWPVTLNSSGTKTYCSVEDAVLRVVPASAVNPGYAGCQLRSASRTNEQASRLQGAKERSLPCFV